MPRYNGISKTVSEGKNRSNYNIFIDVLKLSDANFSYFTKEELLLKRKTSFMKLLTWKCLPA